MFTGREEIRRWLLEVIEKFREKGAVGPDKVMTAEELGLPPSFKVAMKGHLGRLGIFVEVNGKYYLSEEKLKQVEECRSRREAMWGFRKKMATLRIISDDLNHFFRGSFADKPLCSELDTESEIVCVLFDLFIQYGVKQLCYLHAYW